MVTVAVIFGVLLAFGIGANDVANSFGSSVSAKSLTLLQAIIIASILEFSGALLLGSGVSGTIKSKIVDVNIYNSYQAGPAIFMLGNLTALLVGSIWLLTATYFQMPVSTTHTIVASIVGFSFAAEGSSSVNWSEMNKIFISWGTSPAITGFVSFIMFTIVKYGVLKASNPFARAQVAFPIVVFAGVTIDLWLVLRKSNGKFGAVTDERVVKVFTPAAVGSGVVAGLLVAVWIGPLVVKKIEREEQEEIDATAAAAGHIVDVDVDSGIHNLQGGSDTTTTAESGKVDLLQQKQTTTTTTTNDIEDGRKRTNDVESIQGDSDTTSSIEEGKIDLSVFQQEQLPSSTTPAVNNIDKQPWYKTAWKFFADHTFRQDLEKQVFAESKKAEKLWSESESYDAKTEKLFRYVQVFTACLTSFAHGANDVANAIGPLSAIMEVQQQGTISENSDVKYWVLAVGGISISFGFIFFGYRIVKAVGYKIAMITPSRGFCIGLATALFVSIASYLNIPVSTTNCLVGATAGVALASGGLKAVDWLFLLRVIVGWILIFFISAITNGLVFSFCAYSPTLMSTEY
jgi:sodium-dependent phosphate transporter